MFKSPGRGPGPAAERMVTPQKGVSAAPPMRSRGWNHGLEAGFIPGRPCPQGPLRQALCTCVKGPAPGTLPRASPRPGTDRRVGASVSGDLGAPLRSLPRTPPPPFLRAPPHSLSQPPARVGPLEVSQAPARGPPAPGEAGCLWTDGLRTSCNLRRWEAPSLPSAQGKDAPEPHCLWLLL